MRDERERLVVVWRVTEACNLSCGFCRYDQRQPFARKSADPELVLQIGKKLSDHQSASGIPIHVSFLGGEPLLWPPFVEVVRAFRALGLGTGVTTNGTRLGSAKVYTVVRDAIDELTISIDGLEAFHDRIRGWPGGFGRLRVVIAALARSKQLTGRGPLLRANVVLMRDNIDDFGQLARELESLGIEQVTFNQLGGNDRPEFFAEHRLLPDQVARFAERLPRLRRELGITLRGSASYLERISATTHGKRLPVSDCAPGERFLYLDENALAAPCSFTASTLGIPLTTGRVDTLAATFRRTRAPSCADCPSTHVFGKFA